MPNINPTPCWPLWTSDQDWICMQRQDVTSCESNAALCSDLFPVWPECSYRVVYILQIRLIAAGSARNGWSRGHRVFNVSLLCDSPCLMSVISVGSRSIRSELTSSWTSSYFLHPLILLVSGTFCRLVLFVCMNNPEPDRQTDKKQQNTHSSLKPESDSSNFMDRQIRTVD